MLKDEKPELVIPHSHKSVPLRIKNKIDSFLKTKPSIDFRRKEFVRCLLSDPMFNVRRAAIKAGYSPKTAIAIGSKILSDPITKAEIDRRLKDRELKNEVTNDAILSELMRIATVNIKNAFNDDGTLKLLKDIPDDIMRCVSGIKVDEIRSRHSHKVIGHTKAIQFLDKVRALEMLGKYLALFIERTEVINTKRLVLVFPEDMKKESDVIETVDQNQTQALEDTHHVDTRIPA